MHRRAHGDPLSSERRSRPAVKVNLPCTFRVLNYPPPDGGAAFLRSICRGSTSAWGSSHVRGSICSDWRDGSASGSRAALAIRVVQRDVRVPRILLRLLLFALQASYYSYLPPLVVEGDAQGPMAVSMAACTDTQRNWVSWMLSECGSPTMGDCKGGCTDQRRLRRKERLRRGCGLTGEHPREARCLPNGWSPAESAPMKAADILKPDRWRFGGLEQWAGREVNGVPAGRSGAS